MFIREDIKLEFNGKFSPGYLYTPKSMDENHPAIVMCHGNYKEGQDKEFIVKMASNLAECGFVVLSFDNLLYNKGWKPDKDISECPEEIDFRWAAFKAVSFLCKLDFVRKDNITIVGHSLGATIALAVGGIDERIAKVVCISPTRVSRFIFDKEASEYFWKTNICERLDVDMDINAMRIIRSVTLEENSIRFLKSSKPVCFIYGKGERFFGYDKWIEGLHSEISENSELICIPKARHYFGTSPDPEDEQVFENVFEQIKKWLMK